MTTYGLTSAGLVAKPATQAKIELDAAFKAVFGASIGSNPDGSIPAASSIGQEISIIVDAVAAQWDAQQALYSGIDPDQANDRLLDIICALTGTVRLGSLFTQVYSVCIGTAGTLLPKGRVASVPLPLTLFDSAADATLSTAAAWATSKAYALNAFVVANAHLYVCSVAGTSANAGGGPAGTGTSPITDNTCSWLYLGASTLGVALVAFNAEVSGALQALSGQLNTIVTPVSGWTSVKNFQDASTLPNALGRPRESNPALRARRQVELQADGTSPDAILAAMLRIVGVLACKVFVNKTDAVNADGVPAHGVEVLLLAPSLTDAVLALAVWKAVGAGDAFGGNTGPISITDASGTVQTVKFSRPVAVPIYLIVTVYYDPAKWPATGAAAAVTAAALSSLLTYALAYTVGESVYAAALSAALFDGPSATTNASGTPAAVVPAPSGSIPMPGVVNATVLLGVAPAPGTSNPVAITSRQIATFSSVNTTIIATPQSP